MGAFLGCIVIAIILSLFLYCLVEQLERIADALEDYVYDENDEEDKQHNDDVAI